MDRYYEEDPGAGMSRDDEDGDWVKYEDAAAALAVTEKAAETVRFVSENRVKKAESERGELRGGVAGPYEKCTDCGRAMVWARNVWMCPVCVLHRMNTAETAIAGILTEIDCRIEHGAESNGHLEALRDLIGGA
jgi:hypothetical protein